jgi:aspartate/methionine/tyrosine aminotransferase
MKIPIFELERVQSLYENTVEYNLTESGFHPLKLSEFLTTEQIDQLSEISIGYGYTNGSNALRERIAALYDGQSIDNVQVTAGSSEANFVACHTLLEAGDEIVIMVPNYMQIWGIAEEIGAVPRAFHLREEGGWAPDLDELRSLVNEKTRMIVLCNPNNPTGATLTDDEMQEIVDIANSVGAWVYSDEVYRGAELDGEECRSFAGMYERALVNGGLSKAYALPGLRLGWLTGPAEIIAHAWAYHDYTSISVAILSDVVAEIALSPSVRPKILDRNRSMLRRNLEIMVEWLADFGDHFNFVPPKAGGMAFVRYDLDINSTELSDWLRTSRSVFIVAGDCFGMDHYFRVGIGADETTLQAGLARVREGLKQRFEV